MNIETNTIRLLGAAQLLVIVGGVITERLLASAVGSGGISDILVDISENLTRMRISNLVALVQSFVIVVLGCFLAAAITLTVTKIGTNALIPLSQEFVEAGAPKASYFQTLGDFLYSGIDRRGNDIQMLFMGLGLILWSYLLFISKLIPRGLAVWGLAAIVLFSISALLQLYDCDFFRPAMILALPYAPY